MEAKETIQIKPMNLPNQKMSKDGELKLEFYDKYFKYIGDFYAEEPKDRDDRRLGWDTVLNYFEVIVDKKSVCGFEKSWVHRHEYWTVYVFVNGMAEDIKMFFKTEKEAEAVVNKLITYLYD